MYHVKEQARKGLREEFSSDSSENKALRKSELEAFEEEQNRPTWVEKNEMRGVVGGMGSEGN